MVPKARMPSLDHSSAPQGGGGEAASATMSNTDLNLESLGAGMVIVVQRGHLPCMQPTGFNPKHPIRFPQALPGAISECRVRIHGIQIWPWQSQRSPWTIYILLFCSGATRGNAQGLLWALAQDLHKPSPAG